MAFTRKALAGLGLNEDMIEKVMTLHGTSMSDFIPKSELKTKIEEAVQEAQKNAPLPDVTQTDEYKAVADERDMLRAVSGEDFSEIKPKFRETVYKMLDRGDDAAPIPEQLKTVFEKYEEYFEKKQTEPIQTKSPQFGAPVQGKMPSGEKGNSFSDFWGFVPQKG